MRTPSGHTPSQDVRVDDLLLSRDECNPSGLVVAQRVEEVFVREGLILELKVLGRTIRTTAEHPFHRYEDGWVACNLLQVGDRIALEDGWAEVEGLVDTGSWETVYNFRIADFHTYFVGCDEWGFAVWAHNNNGCVHLAGDKKYASGYDAIFGGKPKYQVDASGLTIRAEGRIIGSHPGRVKGYRPEPVGGRQVGDHRGHLIPENGVANPSLVNVKPNIIAEAAGSNLGPKKQFENLAIRMSDDNPLSRIDTIHEPLRMAGATRPFAVTHWITKDGQIVYGLSILNR